MTSTIAVQHTASGVTPTFQAATAAGDTYPSTGKELLQLINSGPVPVTLTVAAITQCNQNKLHPLTISVPGGASLPFCLGPVTQSIYTDGNSNAEVSYSTTVQAPPGAASVSLVTGGVALSVGTFKYQVTFVNGSGETTGGTEVSIATNSGNQAVTLQAIPLGPGGTTARKIYRTAAGGASGSEKLVTTLSDNTTTTYQDTIPDASLGAAIPTSNTAAVPPPGAAAVATATGSTLGVGAYKYQVTFQNAQGQTTGGAEFSITTTTGNTNVSITSVPIGPAGTTARKIHRTSVGGASGTEKLVTTLNDNTTTTFTDNVADASLGASIPGTNTASVVTVAVTSI